MNHFIELREQRSPSFIESCQIVYSLPQRDWWNHCFEATTPSDSKETGNIFSLIESPLLENGFAEDEISEIQVAFEEAFDNAAIHGNKRCRDKTIQVCCRVSPARVEIEIQDEGDGFDPESVLDPTLDENLASAGGRGLLMMHYYMTRVTYSKGATRVALIKERTRQTTTDSPTAQHCLSHSLPNDVKKELSNVNSKSKDTARDCDTGSRNCDSRTGGEGQSSSTGDRGPVDDQNPEGRNCQRRKCGLWHSVRSLCRASASKLHEITGSDHTCSHWISSGAFSFQGSARKRNEDRWHASRDKTVFLVADGMGGCPAGDIASELTVEVLAQELAKSHSFHSTRSALRFVNQAFQEANARVQQFGRDHDCRGMGAAVVAAVRQGNQVYISGVGDCRAYVYRDGCLRQLTTDDTLAATLVPSSKHNPELIRRHPFRNLLARCIGSDPLEPVSELVIVDLQPGDRLILCSDGLVKALDGPVVETALLTADTAQQAADHLQQFARAAGSRDDTTAIVVEANEHATATNHLWMESSRNSHSPQQDMIRFFTSASMKEPRI